MTKIKSVIESIESMNSKKHVKQQLMDPEKKTSRPFERAVIGHTLLDIAVCCSARKAESGRPWLTVLVDDYSKRVLAFDLSIKQPSFVSNLAVIRECVKQYSQLPNSLISTSGREFENADFNNTLV